MMQLTIDNYLLQTAKIPKVIEWRINVIGAIIRTFIPIYDGKKGNFIKDKYSSVLNVLFFKDKPILLGTRVSNLKARELIDSYYKTNSISSKNNIVHK